MAEVAPPAPERPSAVAWRWVRRIAVLMLGIPLVIIGLLLLVAPGPGTPVLLAGLAILAIEFAWARRRMHDLRSMARRILKRGDDAATS